jgi:foldase protein PrsA
MSKKKSSKAKVVGITIIIILLLIAAVAAAYYKGWFNLAKPTSKDIIAGKVNDKQITQKELDKQYELFFVLVQYPDTYREQITKKIYLNQIIIEEIILSEAEKEGIITSQVSSQDFKAALDNYLAMNNLKIEALVQNLVGKNLTTDNLQDYFKKQITISNFLNKTLISQLQVSDDEIKNAYDANNESFTAQEGQIRARHILVATEKEAEDIIKQLDDEADFAEIAKEKSIDTASGAKGGELGFFSKDMMVEEFANASFKLKVNEISEPVKSQFGWHIIERESNTIPFGEIKDAIKLQLMQEKQKAALQTYIEQLKAKAKIEVLIE